MTDYESAVDEMLLGAEDSEWSAPEDELQAELDNVDDDADLGYETQDQEWLMETFGDGEGEFSFEGGGSDWDESEWGDSEWGDSEAFFAESGSVLSDAEVEELARDLTGIESPQDMEAFLGKIFKGVSKTVGGALRGSLGRKILRAGSSLIGRALPVVGSALGTAMLPGIGTGLGGALGSQVGRLFSSRGRRSVGRALARTAVRSARRASRRNPLQSVLARAGGGALRSLFGAELDTTYDDPRVEVARRVVRTVADAADTAARNGMDSEAAVLDAFRGAASRHLPPAVRAALLTGPAN